MIQDEIKIEYVKIGDIYIDIYNKNGRSLEYQYIKNCDYVFLKKTFKNMITILSYLRNLDNIKVEKEFLDLDLFDLDGFFNIFSFVKGIKLYKEYNKLMTKYKKIKNLKTLKSNDKFKKLKISIIEHEIKCFNNEIQNYVSEMNSSLKHLIELRNEYRDIRYSHEIFLVKILNKNPDYYETPDKITGEGFKCHYCKSNEHYAYYAWKCSKTDNYCECDYYGGDDENHFHNLTYGFMHLSNHFNVSNFKLEMFQSVGYNDYYLMQDCQLKNYVHNKGMLIIELKKYLLGIQTFQEAELSFTNLKNL